MADTYEFNPEFDIKLRGHAIARYRGPKDDVGKLHEFFRHEKWRGQMIVNYPGNGGVNDIIFDEIRNMSEEKEDPQK